MEEKPLTPLQENFLEVLRKLGEVTPENEEGLKRDIRTMNAAELRQNIKVFTDS